MDKYIIFCTQEQTLKALELGAPIHEAMSRYNSRLVCERIAQGKETIEEYNKRGIAITSFNRTYFNRTYKIPTAEQMIGWLRKEKGLFVEPYLNGECCYSFSPIVSTKEDGEIIHLEAEDDPDKATLAAIDAALDFLLKNNKKG